MANTNNIITIHETRYTALVKTANAFHRTYPPSKASTKEYDLQGNSANAKFALYETGTQGDFVIKVQLNPYKDPIVRDIYMNILVNHYNEGIPPTFMNLVGFFPAAIKGTPKPTTYVAQGGTNQNKRPASASHQANAKRPHLFASATQLKLNPAERKALTGHEKAFMNLVAKTPGYNALKSGKSDIHERQLSRLLSAAFAEMTKHTSPPPAKTPSMQLLQQTANAPALTTKYPSLVVAKVDNCCTLGHLLENWTPDASEELGLPICRFVNALIQFGQQTGFSHNDMHYNNILYNTKQGENAFTLIDYGRVQFAGHQSANVDSTGSLLLDEIIQSLRGQGVSEEFAPAHTKDDDFYKVTDDNNATNPPQVVHVMNDLAGLAKVVLININEAASDTLMKSLEPVKLDLDMVREFNSSENDFFWTMLDEDMKALAGSNPVAFGLAAGYLWNQTLEHYYKKLNLYMYHDLWYKNSLHNHYYIIVPEAFENLTTRVGKKLFNTLTAITNIWLEAYELLPSSGGAATKRHSVGKQSGGMIPQSARDIVKAMAESESLIERDREEFAKIQYNFPDPPVIPLDNNPADVNMLGMLLETYTNAFPGRVAKMKEFLQSKNIAPEVASLVHEGHTGNLVSAKAGGARKRRIFSVKIDRKTQRKYIVKSKVKWYLDEHRNQYRYADASHSSVYLRTRLEK